MSEYKSDTSSSAKSSQPEVGIWNRISADVRSVGFWTWSLAYGRIQAYSLKRDAHSGFRHDKLLDSERAVPVDIRRRLLSWGTMPS